MELLILYICIWVLAVAGCLLFAEGRILNSGVGVEEELIMATTSTIYYTSVWGDKHTIVRDKEVLL